MSTIILELKNVSKKFGGIIALDEVSFRLEDGKIYGLIGPNGAGKTTLFNVISGYIRQDQGQIFVNSEEISGLPPFQRATIFSRTFQLCRNFAGLTVLDNLLLSFHSKYESILRFLFFQQRYESKRIVESLKFLESLEIELESTKLARELSYGQNKLLELSRASLRDCRILLLDEPVAGVNPEIKKKIAKALRLEREKGNKIIILIEHDINFVMDICDYVLAMSNGKIIAEGSPSTVKENPEVLKSYLGE
ncbi:MAG: ABC transporter ATP-binding protein [Deltaproteobacteria bacterium]|nr:ABC transporter ATP-binding protein [Deltaproteobacteria bacterium]